MKRIAFLCILAFFVLASGLFAQDYNGALKAAKQANKPVLLYFYSKSCSYCTLMDRKTLADKDIESTLKKDFVFLRIDSDKASDLRTLYEVPGTPSSWFLEPSGKRILQAPGFVEKGNYQILLDYIKGSHYKNTDLQTYFKNRSKK